jgi:ubiquinone/menaquinone biosynthesis C-methylase UbiE
MRLLHTLAQQFRQPRGLLGRIAGFLFRLNREGIEWSLELLQIQPTDHILEVGFGPGLGIERATATASRGSVTGVDFSETMVRQAHKRNASAIAEGRVDLKLADSASLPFPDNSFDKAFAANVIYFWRDPLLYLRELRRVLKPGGLLALYLISKKDLEKIKLTQTGVYILYTGEEVVQLLTRAGFNGARFETKAEMFRTGICALAKK